MKYKKYTNSSFNQCDIYNILMTYLMIFCNTITLHKVRHVCLYTLNQRYCKGQESIIFKKKNMNLYLDIGLIIMQQFLGGKHFKKVREKNIFIYVKNIKRKRILIIVIKCNATEVLLQHKFCLCLCIYLIYKTIQLMKIIFQKTITLKQLLKAQSQIAIANLHVQEGFGFCQLQKKSFVSP